jgi:hypothetical protein
MIDDQTRRWLDNNGRPFYWQILRCEALSLPSIVYYAPMGKVLYQAAKPE